MLKLVRKWMLRIVATLAIGFVFVYCGDWMVFKLRGSPQSTVTVNRYLSIPLKDNKQEFDYQGSLDVPCSISLFSQYGETPCWQLRRNAMQTIKM